MAEWKRKLYEKILILYPVFVGVWGDKPVIFLYSSIFLYPMLYSCRNSFGKWNFFVIFYIYIPKKKSLILFKVFVAVSITILHTGTLFAKNRTDSQNVFWEWCSKKTQEKRAASGLFAALLNNLPGFSPLLFNETNSQLQGEALLASYFSCFPFLRLHT